MSENTTSREEEIIKLVQRQTNYDEETVKEKLKEHKNNYINVIKEYVIGTTKKTEVKEEIKKVLINKYLVKFVDLWTM